MTCARVAVQVRSYEERSMGASAEGGDARACAFLEIVRPGGSGAVYGVGVDGNIITASVRALVSAFNRSETRSAARAA